MENEEIDLREILQLFWEKRAIILITLIVAVIIGFAYTMFFKEPKYTAYSTLILAQQDSSGDETKAVTQTDITLNDKLIATYKELAKSNSVVRAVINNLNLSNTTESQLKSEINVTAVKETQILRISVTDEDATRAQRITNELSDVFVKKIADLYKIENISIVDRAETPSNPSNINHKNDLLIFFAMGLVVAIGIILILNLLDTTVKSASDIEKIQGLFILAEVPECDFSSKK